MLLRRDLFRRFVINRTKKARRQRYEGAGAESLEVRALLSTVTLDAGTLLFEADNNSNDDVAIRSVSETSFEIIVGNGDTIDLGAGTQSGFERSEGDTVLTVDLGPGGAVVNSIEVQTGDRADTVIVASVPDAIDVLVDGGAGADSLFAPDLASSIDLVGNEGNDTLIGGQADDNLSGGNGRDVLIGGPGSDTLDGGAGADELTGGGLVNVTVTNLQEDGGGLLTPVFLATTDGSYDFFDVGEAASASLESLAEDGDTGPRIDAALNSGGVNEAISTTDGPFGPGESRTAVLRADATNDLTQFFSFASMFIPSNDAFIANDDPSAVQLFDENGNFIERVGDNAIVLTGDNVYDAGTEVNDEIPENTAGLAQMVPDTGETETEVIRQHPGFQGSERLGGDIGSILSANPAADFTVAGAEIARIELSQDDGADVLLGGFGADTLTGGDGSDTLLGGFGRDVLDGGAGDDFLDGNGQIRITVTNLQEMGGGLITPVVLATTDGNYDFFDVGSAASSSLEALAEDGNTGPRIDAALASGGVEQAVATADGPFGPGESREVFLTASVGSGLTQYLSFASMFIPSNDAFFGNDDPMAIDLFGDDGSLIVRRGDAAFIVTGNNVYDAGTEVNDEIPENTAGLDQSAPNTGDTENGVITQHPGFQGSDRLGGDIGNVLTQNPAADFTAIDALVAMIEVDEGLDSDDVIHGGDGNDTISGGRGNDTLIGGTGNDDITGSGGADVVFGNDGADTIVGGLGSDNLDGGNGDDELAGNFGNDVLVGGAGSDTLLGGAGRDDLDGSGSITVTVTNLQEADGGLLTPFFLATGNGAYDFFDVGSAASESLERLAEDGTTGPRIDDALASGGVGDAVATDGGPIAPGESRTVTLSANVVNQLTQYLSFASMFIPSNDAFIGNDDPMAIGLFDETGDLITREGASAIVITGDEVLDAGTEVNDEVPENTAALAQEVPDTGVTEGGVIGQHPGFEGSERLGGDIGNILAAHPNADFTVAGAEVARIEITEDDGDDVLHGGGGPDTLSGGAGNDTLLGGFGRDNLVGGAGDDYLNGGGQITVTITNLQEDGGGLITPTIFTTQNGVYDIFDVGSAASTSLERQAEDGTTGPRIDAALASGGVNEAIATSGGPIAPGESRSVVLDASSENGLTQFLSFTSMFIPSNDAFIGNDDPNEIDLFDDNGALISRTGDDAFFITGDNVYDAGTEVNDEIPENTAALAQSVPDTGVTEGGVITQHPGFQGSEGLGGDIGNILTANPNADFTVDDTLIARIEIEQFNDGNDQLRGGSGNDTIQGAGGNDRTYIDANDGEDVLQSGDGNDRTLILGGATAETIDLSASGDQTLIDVTGGAVFAVTTPDEIIELRTGAGDDLITVQSLTGTSVQEVLVRAGDGEDNVDASAAGVGIFANGGSGADTLVGGAGDDILRGASGQDSLTGSAGDDIVDGGRGADEVIGGADRDFAIGGQGSDNVRGNGGSDLLVSGAVLLRTSDLELIRTEWQSNRTYEERVDNVVDGSGTDDRENGDAFLTVGGDAPTLLADALVDDLEGGDALDAFFSTIADDTADNDLDEELFDLT